MKQCDCHLDRVPGPGGIWRFCNRCAVRFLETRGAVTLPCQIDFTIIPNRLHGAAINSEGDAI